MDDQERSLPPQDISGQVASDAAPLTVDVRFATDLYGNLAVPTGDQTKRLPAAPPRESSLIAYWSTEQRINEGFAIALRAMGLEANLLPVDNAVPTTSPNKEDN